MKLSALPIPFISNRPLALPLLLLIALLQGCATPLQFSPQAAEDQQLIYQQDVQTLLSSKKALVGLRTLTSRYRSNERPTLVVSVLNGTEQPFDFSTDDVRVLVDGQPLKVFSYDELVAEAESDKVWAATATVIGGAAQGLGAAYSGYGYQSGSSYNSATGLNSYSGLSYNLGQSSQGIFAASNYTQSELRAIKQDATRSLEALSSTMLKRSTVMAQQRHGGYVRLEMLPDRRQPHRIQVLVDAAGETHEFWFDHNVVE